MSKPTSRSGARARAFQVLYSLQFTPVETLDELREVFKRIPDPTDADIEGTVTGNTHMPHGFSWNLVEGVWSREAELDAAITQFSHNWRLERLGKVELTILRLAFYELAHETEIPQGAVLNEASTLAARFATPQSRQFINGILENAVQQKK